MRTFNSRFLSRNRRAIGASAAGLAGVVAAVAALTTTGAVQQGGIVAASGNVGGCDTYDVSGASGWNIGVCISGSGTTVNPDIYVNSMGSTGSVCKIDIETWDGNGQRLGDTQVDCPTSTGRIKGDPVTVSGGTTVHAFARLRLDGVSYSSGDSKPVDVPAGGGEGSGATPLTAGQNQNANNVNPDWAKADAIFTSANSLSATSGQDKGAVYSSGATTGDDGIVLLRVFIPAQFAAGNLLLGDSRGFTSDPSDTAFRAEAAWNTSTGQVAVIVNHSSVGPLLVSSSGSEGGAPPPVQIGDPIPALPVTAVNGSIDHQTVDDQSRSDNQVSVASASSGLSIDLSLLNPLTNHWAVGGVNLGAWTADQTAKITGSAGSYKLQLAGNGYPAVEAYYYPHYGSTAVIAKRSVEPAFLNQLLDAGGGEAALDSNSWVSCADTTPSVFECTNTVKQYSYSKPAIQLPEAPWDTADSATAAM